MVPHVCSAVPVLLGGVWGSCCWSEGDAFGFIAGFPTTSLCAARPAEGQIQALREFFLLLIIVLVSGYMLLRLYLEAPGDLAKMKFLIQ